MTRGQIWSADFALSLLLFMAALLVAYTMVGNAFEDTGYEGVNLQARDAATILGGIGYPEYWTTGTVIRGGLSSDGRLSLRKAMEMGDLATSQLRQSLRITDNVYVYATNTTGHVSIFGSCGVGDLDISTGIHKEHLPAIALVKERVLADQLTNITISESNDSTYDDLEQYDVIVLEGDFSHNSSRTALQLHNDFSDLALSGRTFIVIGNPNISILGAAFNTTDTANVQIAGEAGESIGFDEDELVNLVSPGTIEVAELLPITDPSVSDYIEIGHNDGGGVAYASWLYRDSRVWYFNAVEGTREDLTNLLPFMGNVTQDMVSIDRESCGAVEVPTTATHATAYERVLAYHDEPVTLHVLVWRK